MIQDFFAGGGRIWQRGGVGSWIQGRLRERGKAKTGRTESDVKTVNYLDLVGLVFGGEEAGKRWGTVR